LAAGLVVLSLAQESHPKPRNPKLCGVEVWLRIDERLR